MSTEPTNTEHDEQDEHPLPDVETFDINTWLSTGSTDAGRGRETVTVYNDLSLLDEAAQVAKDIEKHNAEVEQNPEDLAVGEKSKSTELLERQADLERLIAASRAVIEVKSLSDSEIDDITVAYKADQGPKSNLLSDVEGTYWLLSEAATIGGQKLPVAQWKAVAARIAGGQWTQVKQAWIKAQNYAPRPDSPFSRSSSRLSEAVRRS